MGNLYGNGNGHFVHSMETFKFCTLTLCVQMKLLVQKAAQTGSRKPLHSIALWEDRIIRIGHNRCALTCFNSRFYVCLKVSIVLSLNLMRLVSSQWFLFFILSLYKEFPINQLTDFFRTLKISDLTNKGGGENILKCLLFLPLDFPFLPWQKNCIGKVSWYCFTTNN